MNDTERISRRQAWMKLAVLIADGLPDPIAVQVDDEPKHFGIWIRVRTRNDFDAWATSLNLMVAPRQQAPDGDWINTAHTFNWHAWYVSLTAYTPPEPDGEAAEEIADDLAKVREVAGGAS